MDLFSVLLGCLDVPTITLGLIVFCISAVIIQRYNALRTFKKMGVPGPEPNFLYGNLDELTKAEDQLTVFTAWTKKYGNIMGYYEGPQPVLLVKDLEAIKLIFIKYSNKFIDRPVGPFKQSRPLDRFLIVLEGEEWRRVRNILSPVFSAKKIKQMSNLMNNGVDTMLKIIDDHAEEKKEFDIFRIFQGLTMQVIGESVFAMDVDCQRDPNDKFLNTAIRLFRKIDYVFLYAGLLFPAVGRIIFYISQKFSLSVFKDQDYLLNTLKDVINRRKKQNEKNTIDMLQLMLDAGRLKDKESCGIDNLSQTNKGKLNEDEIIANSYLFLLAGFETTANTLAYTAHNLAKYPKAQAEVQEELDKIIGKQDKPDYDTVHQLTKLDQVISESLRIFPPVTLFVSRECVEDCDINGLVIPKGMKIVIPVWQLHHDEELWPDPEEFKPERFSSENKSETQSISWIPFGLGPRNCIGFRFALLEIKLALARMLRNFTLVKGESFEDPIQFNYHPNLLSPKTGIFVKAVKRK